MTTTPTTSRRRFYNTTGDRYESGRYGDQHMEGYGAFRNETLLTLLGNTFGQKELRILEVGCGTGRSLEYLAKTSPHHSLFGIDASDTMLAQAAQKASALTKKPRLALGDAALLPCAQSSFDVLFATRFIHQFSHEVKLQLWQEFRRVVRHDGMLIVEFYARPYHWLRYYLGARKGRSKSDYFRHYPSSAEVREIVGQSPVIYPLRLLGSRVLAGVFGQRVVQRTAALTGRIGGAILMDEYFAVSRKR